MHPRQFFNLSQGNDMTDENEPFFHRFQYAEIGIDVNYQGVTMLHYAFPDGKYHFRSGWIMNADQAQEVGRTLLEAAERLRSAPSPQRH